jgi:hypothetical protein
MPSKTNKNKTMRFLLAIALIVTVTACILIVAMTAFRNQAQPPPLAGNSLQVENQELMENEPTVSNEPPETMETEDNNVTVNTLPQITDQPGETVANPMENEPDTLNEPPETEDNSAAVNSPPQIIDQPGETATNPAENEPDTPNEPPETVNNNATDEAHLHETDQADEAASNTTESGLTTVNEQPSTENNNTAEEPTTQDNRNEADDLGVSPPTTLELDELEALQPNRIAELGIKTRVVRAGDDIPDFSLVLLVIDVAPNTAGSQAGIVVGDLILTINSEPPVRPLPQFADAIIGMETYLNPIPGADFVFRIIRDGVELELTAFIA